MVKPITKYFTQKRLSWYGHVMRRDDNNVAKQDFNNDEAGREYILGWPILRWMDRIRSDMKQHQLDPKLAQN